MLSTKFNRLNIEALEVRLNLSSYLQGGHLVIQGTNGHDKCVVSEHTINGVNGPVEMIKVVDNGKVKWYHKSAVDDIVFKGYHGNDYFCNKTDIECDAYGMGGHDTLCGGTSDDDLFGGAGNDSFWCNSGDDDCYGQQGTDVLRGQEGDDLLHGGMGDGCADIMNGGEGNDDFYRDLYWWHGQQRNREHCQGFHEGDEYMN